MEKLCDCGCGEPAGIYKAARARRVLKDGTVIPYAPAGSPRRYIRGHQWRGWRAERYEIDAETGCWNWTGALRLGYGITKDVEGRTTNAHRWFFVEAHGPIPDGLHVDHICRNRRCVNVEHMRLATRSENGQNQMGHRGSSSRFRGVSWNREAQRWRAGATLNGRFHYLGEFVDEERAAEIAAAWRAENMPYSPEARAA